MTEMFDIVFINDKIIPPNSNGRYATSQKFQNKGDKYYGQVSMVR